MVGGKAADINIIPGYGVAWSTIIGPVPELHSKDYCEFTHQAAGSRHDWDAN